MTELEFAEAFLNEVVTVAEVCYAHNVTAKTVMMAIFKEKITARQAQAGNVWLILKSSSDKHFSDPKGIQQREKLQQQRNRKLQAVN
jgi:hypothetical protein